MRDFGSRGDSSNLSGSIQSQRRVEMKLTMAKKICKKLSAQYGIVKPPEVIPMKYSRVGKRVILGYYNHEDNLVELNKYLITGGYPRDFIEPIITHELMHARCYQDFGHGGHGPRFKMLCDLCGVTGDARMRTSKREA